MATTQTHTSNAKDRINTGVSHLRTALSTATALEALVLLPLLERAVALARDIDQLNEAMVVDVIGKVVR